MDYSYRPAIAIPPWLFDRIPGGRLAVGSGIMDHMLEVFAGLEPPVLILGDDDTMREAGLRVRDLLGSRHPDTVTVSLGQRPHCDASALSAVESSVGRCRSLVAVGSGTLNDLGRLVAHRRGMGFFSVATAPSMDGYLSANSSLIEGGVKVSYPGITPPRAVLVDLELLARSPYRMFLAGIGDCVAKLVSCFDWRVDSLVRGTAFDDKISSLLETSAEELVERLLGSDDREGPGKGVQVVTEYLLLSSAVMRAYGSSQPASGGEHLISHVLEMFDAGNGSHGALHGLKVAVCVMKLLPEYADFFAGTNGGAGPGTRIPDNLGPVDGSWLARGIALDAGIRERKLAAMRALDAQAWRGVLDGLRPCADRLARLLPRIRELFERYGLPGSPEDIGVGAEDWRFACEWAGDIRERVTGLDLSLVLKRTD